MSTPSQTTQTDSSIKKADTSLSDFPSTMSCTEAFDQLTSCYSLGGQLRNYYRYGSMNDCVKEFSKFKFCLFNSDPEKIRQFHKLSLQELRTKGSSEDIWEVKN